MLGIYAIVTALTARAADTWTAVAPGVDYLYRTADGPRQIHAVVVDLAQDDLYVRATKEGENGQKTSSFASAVGALVAVNGDFFDYDGYWPVGWAVGDGWGWTGSADGADWGFIACNITQECWIDSWGTAAAWTPRAWNVVGGIHDRLVVDGIAQVYGGSYYDSDRHPRTAAGLSADGRTLILAVIDGRSSASIGMTFNETGALMAELGAYTAIMLDGGGSTTMVLNGSIVNDPSDGSERVVSNHLAVVRNTGGIAAECAALPSGRYCLDATQIASCEGGVYLGAGDCGYYGLTCEESGDFAYCVDPRCAAGGQASYCTGTATIAGCTNGIYSEGDCGYYGAGCAEAYGTAWCATLFYQAELLSSTFAAVVEVPLGGEVTGTLSFTNTGLNAWTPGVTHLAPIPRDTESPLQASSWVNPTRAATVAASAAPGAVGSFDLTLHGAALGEATYTFGLVEDGVTWFADYPYGGGPSDDTIALTVRVVEPGTEGAEDGGEPWLEELPPDVQEGASEQEPRKTLGCACGGGGGSGGILPLVLSALLLHPLRREQRVGQVRGG